MIIVNSPSFNNSRYGSIHRGYCVVTVVYILLQFLQQRSTSFFSRFPHLPDGSGGLRTNGRSAMFIGAVSYVFYTMTDYSCYCEFVIYLCLASLFVLFSVHLLYFIWKNCIVVVIKVNKQSWISLHRCHVFRREDLEKRPQNNDRINNKLSTEVGCKFSNIPWCLVAYDGKRQSPLNV